MVALGAPVTDQGPDYSAGSLLAEAEAFAPARCASESGFELTGGGDCELSSNSERMAARKLASFSSAVFARRFHNSNSLAGVSLNSSRNSNRDFADSGVVKIADSASPRNSLSVTRSWFSRASPPLP